MFEIVNRFREQWNNKKEDNFGSVMPITIYRVTWKNKKDEFFEFWSESEEVATRKKCDIDYDNELSYSIIQISTLIKSLYAKYS